MIFHVFFLFLILLLPLFGSFLLRYSSWGRTYPRHVAQITAGLVWLCSLTLLSQPSTLSIDLFFLGIGCDSYTNFLVAFYTLLFFLLVILCPFSLRYLQEITLIFLLEVGVILLLLSTHLVSYFFACALLSFPLYWKLRVQAQMKREIRFYLLFQIAKLLLFISAFVSLYFDTPVELRENFLHLHSLLRFLSQVRISSLTSGLFAASLLVQLGVFPFHVPSFTIFQRARYGGLIAYLLGHLVLTSMLKFGDTLLLHVFSTYFELLIVLLLLNALYFSVLSLTQYHLRRLIASIYISSVSLGATLFLTSHKFHLLYSTIELVMLSLVFAGLLSALWLAESRLDVDNITQYQGIASRVPGLSAYFFLLVLTGLGFPGTIGYIAEEVVIQRRFNHAPWQGLVSLLVVGINAWVMFRCFARIFLGSAQQAPHYDISLSLRERFALLGFVALILVNGIVPHLFFRFS